MYENMWYCMLPFIALSSNLRVSFASDNNKNEDYSTEQYQLDENTVRNYNDEDDFIWYNLHENSTTDDMQYRINFTSSEDDNLMQYKFRTHFARNDSQMLVESRTNLTEVDDKKNFMPQEIHGNLKRTKRRDDSTSYDFFENFNRDKNKSNIPYKMCDNITCIQLCCPFGNRLVDGKCVAEQDNFIFLQNMYGYIHDSLQNESRRIDELFLLIVHDPCQKTGHYLLNSYQNMFLLDGSLYLPYYNTIIESTSYCLAVVNQNIFAVNVCFDIMKEIMNKTISHNKGTIFPNGINKNLRIESKNNYRSHNFLKNLNENNSVSYKMCDNVTCIQLCCPFGNRLVNGKCIAEQGNFIFLQNIYGYINDSLQKENKRVDEPFLLVVYDPCQKTGHYLLNPSNNRFLVNGSLYLPYYDTIIESMSYCLAVVDQNIFTVNVCLDIMQEILNKTINHNKDEIAQINTKRTLLICTHMWVTMTSLVMFVVYSIVPELRNIHGFTLRRYSGLVFIGYTVENVNIITGKNPMGYSICIACAFVKYYSFLGSWFWLNVMSFNMWRIFRKFRPLQRKIKQKTLIIYSIYGWGGPFIFAVICGIMDFVPGISKNIMRPEFESKCWFGSVQANWLYFYGIVTISVIGSICLSISTGRNIAQYEKDVAHQLRDSESRRYNDNKQWFNLFLEITKVLFIIICIKWFISIIYSIYKEVSYTVWYTFVALDVVQHTCMFIIFVCKKKIRQLLLKRFNCQNRCMFSQTRHAIPLNSTTTSGMMSLWKRINPYKKTSNHGAENSSPRSTEL